ncbi:Neprilysin cd10, peptidase, partial [Globisporangium polare]
MVKVTTRESTPLLYGTDDVQYEHERQQQQSAGRRWKIAVSAAALLCVGAWASAFKGNDVVASSDETVVGQSIRGAQVDFHKTKHSKKDDDATAEFFKSLEAFKNESADPCVDFFEYACGGWLASNEIPSDRPEIDSAFY